MDIRTNIPLKNYVTMRLGGNARFMSEATTPDEARELCRNARTQNIPTVILGDGSNTLVHDEGYNGLVIRNCIMGIEILADTGNSTTIRFGGGESWDDAVKLSVEKNLTGIEAMSTIPGTMGAAPVQNIGAYGQELSDTFVSLDAYDIYEDKFVAFNHKQCHFSYRDSIFRSEHKGRYFILSITLELYKDAPKPPFYAALQKYFDDTNTTLFTPASIREAVTEIRAAKLPDPKLRPNTGSFFKNAIVEEWQLNDLLKTHPEMPHFDLGSKTYKIPTGWLIEHAGLRGEVLHGMRINDKNALVLINESAQNFADLRAARDEIIGKVRDTFRIHIEQEPLEL